MQEASKIKGLRHSVLVDFHRALARTRAVARSLRHHLERTPVRTAHPLNHGIALALTFV